MCPCCLVHAVRASLRPGSLHTFVHRLCNVEGCPVGVLLRRPDGSPEEATLTTDDALEQPVVHRVTSRNPQPRGVLVATRRGLGSAAALLGGILTGHGLGPQIDPHRGHHVPLAGRYRVDQCRALTSAAEGTGCTPCPGLIPGRPDLIPPERSEHVEQAHLPAEQPSATQDPWLPPAHAHPRRPGDPLRASAQGPRPPGRLSSELRHPGVLPAHQRLTSPATFREVVRRGHRCGGSLLIVHLHVPPDPPESSVQVGLVVSKAVGGAVTRNLVKRRLRHLARERVGTLPQGARVVLRALPPSAQASYADLATQLDRCLDGARERLQRSSADARAMAGRAR